MGIIQSILKGYGYKPIIKKCFKKKYYKANISYIVHTYESADCNGTPIKIFKSKRNCFGYAKKLSRRLNQTVYVYKVNLNHYSLGTGDSVGISRYGIFDEYVFNYVSGRERF
jgi:hypothetical protein